MTCNKLTFLAKLKTSIRGIILKAESFMKRLWGKSFQKDFLTVNSHIISCMFLLGKSLPHCSEVKDVEFTVSAEVTGFPVLDIGR